MVQVAESCKSLGAESTHVYPVDLSKPDLVVKFAEQVLADHKGIDVLVNSAGIMPERDGVSNGAPELVLHMMPLAR